MEKRFLASGHPAETHLRPCLRASATGRPRDRSISRIRDDRALDRRTHRAVPGLRQNGPRAAAARDIACRKASSPSYGAISPPIVQDLSPKTGLMTFVDPRLEGGRLNKVTTKDIVKVINFEGQEWLFLPGFQSRRRHHPRHPGRRKRQSDRGERRRAAGMSSFGASGEKLWRDCHRRGRICGKAGTLHPKSVRVPGVLIDHIVVSGPDNHWQSAGTKFNLAFSGAIQVPLGDVPRLALNERLIIARRAAMELVPGCTVNLGIGVPEGVAVVAAGEGVGAMMTLTTEAGTIGGIPAGGHDFGMSLNRRGLCRTAGSIRLVQRRRARLAFLGAAQVDAMAT